MTRTLRIICLVLLTLFMVPLSATQSVRAGDAAYQISGRVVQCEADLNTIPLNSSLPESCRTDVGGAVVNATSNAADPYTTGQATSGDSGDFSLGVGDQVTTSIVLQTALDASTPAGFVSCVFQGHDRGYLGEAVFPLDFSGAAEILVGQPKWGVATCNFLLFTPGGATTASFEGKIVECNVDMRDDTSQANINANCPLAGSFLDLHLTFPNGTSQQSESDELGSFSFSELEVGQNHSLRIDRPSFNDGTVAICFEDNGNVDLNDPENLTITVPPLDGFPFVITTLGATLRCSFLVFPLNTVTGGEPTGQSDSGTSAIDVASYTCPEGTIGSIVDDFWEICEFVTGSHEFTITASSTGETQSQNTGELGDGVVFFAELPSDEWTLTNAEASGDTETVVFCSTVTIAEDTQTDYVQQEVVDNASIVQSIEGGTELFCEWFTIPSSGGTGSDTDGGTGTDSETAASLSFVLHDCPLDYDLSDQDSDHENDCVEMLESIAISIVTGDGEGQGASTDDEGAVSFSLGDDVTGRVTVRQDYPADVVSSAITSCERDGELLDIPFFPALMIGESGEFTVTVVPGSELICNWMNLPVSEAPQSDSKAAPVVPVTIAIAQCAAIPNPNACDPAPAGTQITLFATSGSDPVELVTDDSGTATGDVTEGNYTIATDGDICFIDSTDIDTAGNLAVTGAEPMTLTIFTCTE